MMSTTLKLFAALGAVLIWLWTQKLLGQRKSPSSAPIVDWIHIWTKSVNQYFHRHDKLTHFVLISSSLLIDALGIFLIVLGIWGESVRPLLGLILLFSLRQINQAITILPAPEGMIWRHPGLPSLFVTYGVSNDLFFSGHSALAVFGALELAHVGGTSMAVLALIIALYEMIVVLLLRAHWTMDVFAGAMTALWLHEFAGHWAVPIDTWLARL